MRVESCFASFGKGICVNKSGAARETRDAPPIARSGTKIREKIIDRIK